MTSSPPALAARSATATDPAPATRPAAILAGCFMILLDAERAGNGPAPTWPGCST
ncbi:hypothetical protein ABZ260_16990 [Streptosporangium sp. NPDC006013]|uniref:hypothetical protein n=1 Tax=Streptosporangium sp. NPDC006013 TaxID=3155596 RepID=UPI0033A2806B